MPHIHTKPGEIDRAASAYIVHVPSKRMLLRMHDKYHFWSVPGGHIELHENPIEAALREVKEEVGLDVELIGVPPFLSEGGEYQELLPPRFMNVHAINETHKHVSLVYFARANTREVEELVEPEKSSEIRWFTKEELDDSQYGLKETICHYAKAALKAASE